MDTDYYIKNRFTEELSGHEMELRIYPDPVLSEVARNVQTYDSALQCLADQMAAFMQKNRGIGLAASQVGILYRIITADVKGVDKCLVNPEIKSFCEENENDTEGCLSIPGRLYNVRRSLKIEIKARNLHGKRLHFEAEGLAARVLQHEIDHLNGILICNHGMEIHSLFDT